MGRHMVGASQRLAGRQIPSELGSALKIKGGSVQFLRNCRGWIPRMASLYKVSPEACWAFFQTERTQNISTLSFIQTYSILLSTIHQQRPGCQ